jgi:hypothetical protein
MCAGRACEWIAVLRLAEYVNESGHAYPKIENPCVGASIPRRAAPAAEFADAAIDQFGWRSLFLRCRHDATDLSVGCRRP